MRNFTILAALLIITTSVLAPVGVSAQCGASDELVLGKMEPPGTDWCWAACLQWLYEVYLGTQVFQQWNIAAEMCDALCGTDPNDDVACDDCGWCWINESSAISFCGGHDYSADQIKLYMWFENFEFGTYPAGDPQTMTLPQLQNVMCQSSQTYMLATLGNLSTGAGHMVVVTRIDLPVQPAYHIIRYMDPTTGEFLSRSAYSFCDGTGTPYGAWLYYIGVVGYLGTSTAVGDINSFTVSNEENSHIAELNFEIQGGANPQERAAVYVSTSSAGPARLVGSLVDYVNLGVPVTWPDNTRPDYTGSYTYWLNYGSYFDELAPPSELYPGGSIFVLSAPRPTVDAPAITSIDDVPLDHGNKVVVNWELSEDDQLIDYYNLYKNAHGVWKWLTDLPPGTASYTDGEVSVASPPVYKVSAAHHVGYQLQAGDGNVGIFNEYSAPVLAQPINNFALTEATLANGDTLTMSPAGTEDSLVVSLEVWGSDIAPTEGIPRDWLQMRVLHDSLFVCNGDTVAADSSTSAAGLTTFTIKKVGGFGDAGLEIGIVAPFYETLDTLYVSIRTPDGNSDGAIDLIDWSIMGPYMWSYCGDGVYVAKWDLNFDCVIDVIDYAIFGANFPTSSCEE